MRDDCMISSNTAEGESSCYASQWLHAEYMYVFRREVEYEWVTPDSTTVSTSF